jgi:hypothetical protein
MKKILWLFLILFPQLLCALETVPAGSRVFTLDETVNILHAADDKGQKEFHWDPFFQEGSFSIGGHYGAFPTAL